MRGPSLGQMFLRGRARRAQELQPGRKGAAGTREPSAGQKQQQLQAACPGTSSQADFCRVPDSHDCEYLLINFPLAELCEASGRE